MEPLPCIGCGYCCSKVTCLFGAEVYGAQSPCPGLVWDEEAGRHFCKLLLESTGWPHEFLGEGLAIGAGCSSALFNTWRKDLQCRVSR
jgi:hypothetical protein